MNIYEDRPKAALVNTVNLLNVFGYPARPTKDCSPCEQIEASQKKCEVCCGKQIPSAHKLNIRESELRQVGIKNEKSRQVKHRYGDCP